MVSEFSDIAKNQELGLQKTQSQSHQLPYFSQITFFIQTFHPQLPFSVLTLFSNDANHFFFFCKFYSVSPGCVAHTDLAFAKFYPLSASKSPPQSPKDGPTGQNHISPHKDASQPPKDTIPAERQQRALMSGCHKQSKAHKWHYPQSQATLLFENPQTGILILELSRSDFSNSLIVQQKKWTSPMPEKRICTASSIYTAYTPYTTLCPNGDTWKGKSQPQMQGKNKRMIAFFPTPPPS